jgi:beta-glucanase (GH16 family)
MARDKAERGREAGRPAANQTRKDSKLLDRREYVKLAGASVAALCGVGLGSSSAAAVSEGGPSNPDNWELAFEDTFDSGSLDTSNWGIGFGWGDQTNYSPSRMTGDNVELSNGRLKLKATQGSSSSEYLVGGVHTKNNVTFGPGSYVEAKIKVMDLPGSTNAFWSKPNSEAWPPEIDFMECPTARMGQTMHNIHYSSSGTVGDGSTHTKTTNGYYQADTGDMQDRFFIYGCEWQQDSIAHYVDGNLVGRTTDSTVTDAVAAGAPFYLMLNVLVGGWPAGEVPSDWSGHDTAMEVDWVRVWNQSSSSDSSGSDDSSQTDSEHYLWVRSADGSPASFEFTASGGNIRLDSSSYDADYWIGDNGKTAGGTVSKTSSLPGFWYEGEITEFTFDGSIKTYVDDQQVDPSSLGGSSSGSTSSDPTIESVTVSKSSTLGDDKMFVVRWNAADAAENLDSVEVQVVKDTTQMNFEVTDVSGASASGWDIFQFPTGSTVDVIVTAQTSNGGSAKQTKTVTL